MCQLQAVAGNTTLDVSALKSLDSLRCLRLCDGTFFNFQFALCQTFLQLVKGLHAHGLSACQNLENLQLCNAHVHAENAADVLSASTSHQDVWPSSLLRLKKLFFLYVVYGDSQGHSKLNSIFDLTQLKELWLDFAHSVFIGNGLAKLSNLGVLTFSSDEFAGQSESCIECAVDWHMMSGLQQVTFDPGSLSIITLNCMLHTATMIPFQIDLMQKVADPRRQLQQNFLKHFATLVLCSVTFGKYCMNAKSVHNQPWRSCLQAIACLCDHAKGMKADVLQITFSQ